MIIDSHAHYDPHLLPVESIVAKMDAAGVDRVALIPAMNGPLPGTPELLLALARKLSMSASGRLVVEAVHRRMLTSDGNLRLSGEIVPVYSRPDNEGVVALCRTTDRFLGWIFLNPRHDPHVLEELERLRGERGMVGIKLHPHWHDYRSEILRPLLRRAEELGLPALIHLGFRKRGDFRSICAEFPRLRVISAHAGFPFYKDLWRYKSECPNLYVDLSSPYIDEKLARAAVAAMGPERCLYGTDAPYGFDHGGAGYDYGAIKGWIDRMPLNGRARDWILGENFRELARLS